MALVSNGDDVDEEGNIQIEVYLGAVNGLNEKVIRKTSVRVRDEEVFRIHIDRRYYNIIFLAKTVENDNDAVKVVFY